MTTLNELERRALTSRPRRSEALYWCAFLTFIALVFALRILIR
jgi:hypothetical protein